VHLDRRFSGRKIPESELPLHANNVGGAEAQQGLATADSAQGAGRSRRGRSRHFDVIDNVVRAEDMNDHQIILVDRLFRVLKDRSSRRDDEVGDTLLLKITWTEFCRHASLRYAGCRASARNYGVRFL